MKIDLFCQVIDNLGDAGVCWRLARQMCGERQWQVRLFIDQPGALDRLRQGSPAMEGVSVIPWQMPEEMELHPAEVVIEAFGCRLPDRFVAAMANATPPPVWINLEYLSAETWVEDCHGLPSPHPTLPLVKYFFFPGFTSRTGGLLCEKSVAAAASAFARDNGRVPFLRTLGLTEEEIEESTCLSMFCYPDSPIAPLVKAWQTSGNAITCLVPEGSPPDLLLALGLNDAPGSSRADGCVHARVIPFLPQDDYDRLLCACDVNFVRGEDSFLRAQWAERPFIWQPYRQTESTHLIKLGAFLARYLDGLPEASRRAVTALSHDWSSSTDRDLESSWASFVEHALMSTSFASHGKRWAAERRSGGTLLDRLAQFIESKLE